LKRKQIGIAAIIQGDRGYLGAADDLADLRVGRFHANRVLVYRDRLGANTDFQYSVDYERAIGVDGDAGSLIEIETRFLDRDVVAADGEIGK
jgi:hypothetical protein